MQPQTRNQEKNSIWQEFEPIGIFLFIIALWLIGGYRQYLDHKHRRTSMDGSGFVQETGDSASTAR